MPSRKNPAIARFLRSFADRLDPPLPTHAPAHPTELEKLFESLVRLDFKPRHIVDVGAHRGNWTRVALRYFPDAHYTLLEPQPDLRKDMQDLLDANSRIHLHSVGAGIIGGELAFTIYERDDSCTFSLSAQEAEARGLHQVRVPVVSLDALIAQSGLPAPAILKIDAEGFDLEVMKGAEEVVRSCDVLFVEAGIMNKEFSNDLRTVINRAAELGFRPLDITDLNRTQKHGSLWLVEIAFTRIGGDLDLRIATYV